MGGRGGVACAALVAVALISCSGSDSPAPSTVTTPTTTSTVPERFARGNPDGVLTIGILLPRTGAGATLGEPLVNVVNAAVAAVNAAGGVNGHDIVVKTGDEGSDPSQPGIADDLLIDTSIDAIIGPASSRAALAVLPTITDAGVADCSPTATSIALTGLPDHGLFFRTVPSDALEAAAMFNIIDQTGRGSVGLVYTDDVYGRPFAAALRQALAGRNVSIVVDRPYDPDDDDFSEEAADIVGEAPPVVAVIGDTASGGRMVTALLAAGGNEPLIVANDAIRNADFGSQVSPGVLEARVSGASVSAYEGSGELLAVLGSQDLASAAFAAAAVDCVNLLALGAAASSPDNPVAMVAAAIELSVGGQPCATFAECRPKMDELKIDYDGPTGRLELDANGDVRRASYDVYGFDSSGADVTLDQIVVSGA